MRTASALFAVAAAVAAVVAPVPASAVCDICAIQYCHKDASTPEPALSGSKVRGAGRGNDRRAGEERGAAERPAKRRPSALPDSLSRAVLALRLERVLLARAD